MDHPAHNRDIATDKAIRQSLVRMHVGLERQRSFFCLASTASYQHHRWRAAILESDCQGLTQARAEREDPWS